MMVSGQGVVVRVADAAYRGHNARFGEAFGIADREVLAPPDALLFVKGRFVSVEYLVVAG